MTAEAKDIRDLTKAVNTLVRAATALNNTLVTMERNRLAGKLPENLIPMCKVCARGDCTYGTIVDETMAKGCRCCQVEHEPGALTGAGS